MTGTSSNNNPPDLYYFCMLLLIVGLVAFIWYLRSLGGNIPISLDY
jgi:hypothetical protein